MKLETGDPVELRLGRNEYVSGEVVDTYLPDMFSEGWKVLALITEGGHPKFGQVALFHANDVLMTGVTG